MGSIFWISIFGQLLTPLLDYYAPILDYLPIKHFVMTTEQQLKDDVINLSSHLLYDNVHIPDIAWINLSAQIYILKIQKLIYQTNIHARGLIHERRPKFNFG